MPDWVMRHARALGWAALAAAPVMLTALAVATSSPRREMRRHGAERALAHATRRAMNADASGSHAARISASEIVSRCR